MLILVVVVYIKIEVKIYYLILFHVQILYNYYIKTFSIDKGYIIEDAISKKYFYY